MYDKGKTVLAAALLLAGSSGVAGVAQAEDTIKMGALATLEGAFAALGEDSMRGVTMALEEIDHMVAGKKIELITGSSDASPQSAINATKKLVEQDGVQVMVGPLSGSEGLALKDYAKTQPNVTFVNGTLGRPGHDAPRAGLQLLPLQHRGCAVDGRPRGVRLQREGLPNGGGPRRGLLVPVHPGVRLPRALLPTRRQGAGGCPLLGPDRQQGLLVGHRRTSG